MNKRKHELEQNELADKLGEQIEKIKPYLPRIGLIIAVVVLAIVAGYYWMASRSQRAAAEWREFFFSSNEAELGDERGLQTVAEMYPDSNAGMLALLQAGDFNYITGSQNLGKDRDAYINKLTIAADYYEQVVDADVDMDPFIRRRATFALAHTFEALGRFDDATRYYQMILDEAAESPLAEPAEQAIERISDEANTAVFLAFETWEPTTTAPGAGPVLPRRPDISFPQPASNLLPDGGEFDPAPIPGETGGDSGDTSGNDDDTQQDQSEQEQTESTDKTDESGDGSEDDSSGNDQSDDQ